MAGLSQIYADGFARDLIPRSTAPTFLSSTSYAVGDYVYYQGSLYRCTTAHTGTWVASHFTAVTIGSELKAKEASLQSEIDDVKSDLNEYGAISAVSMNGTFYPSTLTVNYEGNSATVSGTTTGGGFTHSTFYNNASSFPDGIEAGDTIQLSQICADDNVRFRFAEYVDGTATVICDIAGTGTEQVKISEDATGCFIRLSFANGKTYNNTQTNFYVFTSLTKQQIESAINETGTNTSDISYLESLMPMDYVPIDVTRTAGLVNKYNGVATPEGYSYVKQAVAEGDKYKVSGTYYGGNYPAYLILNNNSVLSFHNETTTGAFHGLEVTIPANATHIVVNGNTASPASLSLYKMVKANAGGAKSYDSVLVGTTEDYTYTNINNAIVDNPNAIISVDYGTYETEIQNLATDKIIVGKDKNLCVLNGTNRNYDTPPIEISGGIVKHFTVNMVNAEDASHKGYCLHSDTSSCIGKTLIVEDCLFDCKGQHTIGMGIWQNENVLFKNCEFVFSDTESTPAIAPFFAHNSGTSDGVATVRFHNCIFRGSGYALKLSSYSSNCTMRFEFIGCTFESATLTGENMIWTDYVTGDTHDQDHLHVFRGKMPLLATSHGNNISIVNS